MTGPENAQINGTLLATCCEEGHTGSCTLNSSNHYNDGCVQALMDFVEDNAKIIGGIAVGFAVFEVRLGYKIGKCETLIFKHLVLSNEKIFFTRINYVEL